MFNFFSICSRDIQTPGCSSPDDEGILVDGTDDVQEEDGIAAVIP